MNQMQLYLGEFGGGGKGVNIKCLGGGGKHFILYYLLAKSGMPARAGGVK